MHPAFTRHIECAKCHDGVSPEMARILSHARGHEATVDECFPSTFPS